MFLIVSVLFCVRGKGRGPCTELQPWPPSVQGPSLNMFKLVQLGPHCTQHVKIWLVVTRSEGNDIKICFSANNQCWTGRMPHKFKGFEKAMIQSFVYLIFYLIKRKTWMSG